MSLLSPRDSFRHGFVEQATELRLGARARQDKPDSADHRAACQKGGRAIELDFEESDCFLHQIRGADPCIERAAPKNACESRHVVIFMAPRHDVVEHVDRP